MLVFMGADFNFLICFTLKVQVVPEGGEGVQKRKIEKITT